MLNCCSVILGSKLGEFNNLYQCELGEFTILNVQYRESDISVNSYEYESIITDLQVHYNIHYNCNVERTTAPHKFRNTFFIFNEVTYSYII